MEKLIKLNNEFYLVKSDYHDGIKQSILIVSGREVLACTQKFEKLPMELQQKVIRQIRERKGLKVDEDLEIQNE